MRAYVIRDSLVLYLDAPYYRPDAVRSTISQMVCQILLSSGAITQYAQLSSEVTIQAIVTPAIHPLIVSDRNSNIATVVDKGGKPE